MTDRDSDMLADPRLAAALRAFSDEAVRTFEPRQVAEAAIAAGTHAPWWSRRRASLWPEGRRGVAWAAVVLLAAMVLVAGALLAGALVHRPPIAPPVTGAGCDVMDPLAAHAGAVDGGGWPSAPAPGPRSAARPGLLAGWVNYAAAGSQTLDEDVALLDPATAATTRLTHFDKSFSSQTHYRVEWSPDGSALAIQFDDHHQCTNLYVATADGSRLVRPARDTRAESNGEFGWAPDGSALATIHYGPAPAWTSSPAAAPLGASASTSLRLLPRDGSPALELGKPCPECYPVDTPVWSPDGSLVATVFFRQPAGFNTTATGTGVAVTAPDRVGWTILREEPPREPGYLSPIGWLDARRMLAQRSPTGGNSAELVILSIDGGVAPTSAGLVLPSNDTLVLSPDGRAVIDVGGTYAADSTPLAQEVKVIDLASGASHTVWTSGVGINVDPVWSPDSREVEVTAVADAGGDTTKVGVWIVNADGTALRRVRADPMYVVWQSVWQ